MSRTTYSSSELRDINDSNKNRLPPATAVYNMAVHELERGAENERLFHSAMFDLSELRGASTAQQSRIDFIESTAKACASRHDNERTISPNGVRSIQEALQYFTPSDTDPKAVIKRSAWLSNELDQEAASTEDQVALTAVLASQHTHLAKMDLQKTIEQLKDDHLIVVSDLLDVKGRVSKLEDLVRALTAQKNGASDPPKMAQEIKVSTRYGKAIIVKIPKGKALVPHKPSRSQSSRPKHHVADNAPSSQSVPEFAAVNNADMANSSSDTNDECIVQLSKATAETLEKARISCISTCADELSTNGSPEQPLPPVPSVTTSRGATPTVKSGRLDVAPISGESWPISAPPDAAIAPVSSAWDSSAVSAVPAAHPSFNTSSATDPLHLKSTGKGKAKKWTDPPIFQDNQISATQDRLETSSSYRDDAKASGSANLSNMHKKTEINKTPFSGMSITNETLAETPFELKKETSLKAPTSKRSLGKVGTTTQSDKPEPKQEVSTMAPSNKRSFGDFTSASVDSKPLKENQVSQAKQVHVKINPSQSGLTSSVDEIKDMVKSGEQKDNYVTSTPSKAATADQGSAVPRTSAKPAAPGVVYRITSAAPSRTNKASESANTSKSVRRSAIKVKADTEDLASSTEQSSLGKSKDVTSDTQFSTLSLNATSAHQEPMVSPAASTAFSPVDASGPVNPPTSKAAMSPEAPSFQPNAFSQRGPTQNLPERVSNSSFTESLMAKMTPEAKARFNKRLNSLNA